MVFVWLLWSICTGKYFCICMVLQSIWMELTSGVLPSSLTGPGICKVFAYYLRNCCAVFVWYFHVICKSICIVLYSIDCCHRHWPVRKIGWYLWNICVMIVQYLFAFCMAFVQYWLVFVWYWLVVSCHRHWLAPSQWSRHAARAGMLSFHPA